MTPIAPAEALLAVIGVRPIISHRIEVITPAQWTRAEGITDECDAIAVKMVRGELDSLTINDFERIDYSATLRDLSTPYVPEQVEAMLMNIPLGFEGLHAAFEQLAKKAFDFLYSQFPITLRKAVGADNNTKPPRRLVSRFESLLWLMDNPLGVFNLMGNATLSRQQLDGMHAIYPTLCQQIENESLPDAVENERIAKPRFQLERRAEAGVKRFLGRLDVAPELRQLLQAKPTDEGQHAPPPAKPGVLSKQTAPRSAQMEQGS